MARREAVAVLLALLASPLAAQEVSEKDYFGDLPVVLSVSRLAQPLDEVPGAVTIIDAETIRRSGAREVAEVLRLVPGFLMTRRNGGNTIAAYHSALDANYGARMQVYVDGRSVFSSFLMGDTHRGLGAVELADIERIEVLRGSNSAAFGANAFLGVVNIITRAPADTHGVSVSVTQGDHGVDDNFLRVGWGNEVADMRLTASRRATSGFDSLYDDSRRSQMQFRGDFRVSPADEVSVSLGVATDAYGEGFQTKPCEIRVKGNVFPAFCDTNKERTDFWRNDFARFEWTRALSETSILRISGGIDQELYRSRFLAQVFVPPALPALPVPLTLSATADNGGKALRQNLEVQRTDIWRSDLRTVFGAEILREELRSTSLFSTDASISAHQFRIFGGIEWKPVKDWIINAGGMWEKHSMVGSNFAPRLAVNYHLLPDHTLRAVTTQSFRMPSIFMLRGDSTRIVTATPPVPGIPLWVFAAATGKVRSESIIANELGYLGEWRRFGLKLDVRAFSERMNNRMAAHGGDILNYPGPDIHGFEYQFDWRPFAATRIVFSEAQLREIPGRSDNASEPVEAPHRTGSVALYQKLPGGFDLSLITYYSTPYQWAGSSEVLDGMRQLDARLAYAFRVGATRGELAVTWQSIGNSHMEYFRNQWFGRRAFTSLKLDF